MANKVLIVLTSHDQLGDTGRKTGFWKEEFATPYYALVDAGIEVTLATPKGGAAPIDPGSEGTDYATESTNRLDQDSDAQAALKNTVRLDAVDPADFDAVFFPGGHGPLWDLVDDENSIALIEKFYGSGKPVAAVCHASAALVNAKDKEGTALVKDKTVTGFTNEEENAVGLTEVVPLLVEDALKGAGGKFSDAGGFAPNAVTDGLIITGQNPASSALVAEALVKALKAA
jgi:putative intracellular protease/amidase